LRAFTIPLNVISNNEISAAFNLIVENAANVIFKRNGRQGFSEDVLHIKLAGPNLSFLSFVDLPRLFHGTGLG
jgi:hypothetical protein